VHRVYGPPDLDKGKEEAGDAPQPARTPALGEPLVRRRSPPPLWGPSLHSLTRCLPQDSLQSFLGELASSTPHVAEDQHTVSIKVPVMRETVEAQLDDYGSLLDDEVRMPRLPAFCFDRRWQLQLVKLMASVEGEGRGELDAIRYELVTQAVRGGGGTVVCTLADRHRGRTWPCARCLSRCGSGSLQRSRWCLCVRSR